MSLGNDPDDLRRRTEPEQRACFVCGAYHAPNRMETIDISGEDDYYPETRYVCPDCTSDSTESKEDT